VRGSTILAKPNNAAIASGQAIRKVTNIFHPVTNYVRECKGSTVLLNQVNPARYCRG
jgi:hypothetical protein